ncbi:MAG: HD domain-containing phosphohydrolase, partial [Halanaerobacter sp.]
EQDLWEIRKEADANMYQNKLKENEQVKAKIMKALISKLEAESAETAAHTLRMQKLSFQLGEKLGLSMHKLEALSSLATLHDIGKIVVDKEILTKPDTLTEEEWLEVKEHAKVGYRITSSTDEFAHIAKEILNHHEHWDGKGYPEGLTEDEIPFLSRIISIVDAYDVMISGRPYKEAMTEQEAKEELQREAGKQFDPELVEEFLEVI